MDTTPKDVLGLSNPKVRRWKSIYPAYIDSAKTLDQGRKIAKTKGIENPTIQEIGEICQYYKLNFALEPHKMYPKDWMNPGRVKVELVTEAGQQANPNVKNKKDLLKKLCELIPKLKSRVTGGGSQTTQGGDEAGGKKKKNKRGKN